MPQSNNITIPVSKPKRLGPEHNVWFWNPNRLGAGPAPAWFAKRLKDVDPELAVTWSPLHERWLVWVKSPKFRQPLCQGWRLLFVHHDANRGYLPLDDRVLARVFEASVYTHGSAKRYFDRIIGEMERDDERKDKRLREEAIDRAMPHFEYSKIKNIGTGSKFADYLA